MMWILTISTHFFLFPCGRPWCSPPCCAHSRTTSRPGLSKLPAAFRRLGWVTLGTLSHCDVCWALPVSCKERLTLKSLLAWVLLSKRGGGPCFVAVLLGYISSFLAWRVRAALDGWHKGQAFLCKVCPVGMGIHNVKWKEDPFLVLCPFFFSLSFLLKAWISTCLWRACVFEGCLFAKQGWTWGTDCLESEEKVSMLNLGARVLGLKCKLEVSSSTKSEIAEWILLREKSSDELPVPS